MRFSCNFEIRAVNVKSVRIVDIRPVDESENTAVNYNDDNDDNSDGYSQYTTNLISGKWYTVQCWSEGASPKATIEWSIDGNGTLADEEIPSPLTSTRITVIEVSNIHTRTMARRARSQGRFERGVCILLIAFLLFFFHNKTCMYSCVLPEMTLRLAPE